MALTAAATLTLGCGGPPPVNLPGPDSTSSPLERTQYLALANQICRATTQAIVDRTDDVGSNDLGTDAGNREKLLETVEPITTQALTKLRNLTPPPELADLARTAIDTIQSAADAARSDPTAPLDPIGLNKPELFEAGLTGCFTKR